MLLEERKLRTSKIILIASAAFATGCGGGDDSKTDPPVIYGNLTLSDSTTAADNTTLQMTNVAACSRNADTGRVDVTLSQGQGRPSLALAIKDYSSDPKTYQCKQAADNATSDTSVGGKFETCMVAVTVPSSASATTLNGYSMYRESTNTRRFAYNGSCSITVTTATPSIAGSFVCSNMVQTTLEGAPRNPIDPAVVAKATGDFKCNFQ